MKLRFVKMHGCGNDFVVIDARFLEKQNWKKLAPKLLDRRFGIGADQLLVLEKMPQADSRMLIFERDGNESEMCGNGIRCAARLLQESGVKGSTVQIETLGGRQVVELESFERVRVDMGRPRFDESKAWGETLKVGSKELRAYIVSMGNPHCVIFVEREEDLAWVTELGPKIETLPRFPQRTNVEFVYVRDRTNLIVRVWERGAGETWACGSGACAVGVAALREKKVDAPVKLHFRGGVLEISWRPNESVFMVGPAAKVFEGEIEL